MNEPDIDICPACGEHAEFDDGDGDASVSSCCGATPYDTDPDLDFE